ncbi:MAG: wax ester/triacylglycerol synthase domain-containing protein [Acidimicrobiales bacterium]
MSNRNLHFERRMSDPDALMWTIELDPLLRSTITSVSILDKAPDRELFSDRIERASRSVIRLRQLVAPSPYNLAPPEFVIDDNFHLGYHLRWQRAPANGTLRDALDFAEPFAMTGFDHSRPLWEMVVLEDLEDGRTALVQKIHHSLADGVGMMKLSMAFLDLERQPSRPPGPMPGIPVANRPSAMDQIRAGIEYRARRRWAALGSVPGRVGAFALNPVKGTLDIARSASSAARVLRPVSEPLSPLMTGRSRGIRFDTLTASLPAMKVASKLVNGRLNDAFLAAVAGGLDRYHRTHGVTVDQLRMSMPINIRPKDDVVAGGNQFVPMRFAFPVSVTDPVERMVRMRDLVIAQRSEPALDLAKPIAGLLNRLPGFATAALFGGMLKAVDVVTTNVPGAPRPVFIAGARVDANFGYGPLTGAACNITLLSYIDELQVGISTDPAAVPDPGVFVACMQDGFAEIEKLAED